MEQTVKSTLKLNYKRTFLIGFAFFGILLLWQVYDSWCPTLLTELFKEAFNTTNEEEVQYLVGVVMAMDNLIALILLPIFGAMSDKTNTKIGKRMPYILVGTFVCAIAFPFIPVFFHLNNLAGVIIMMAIVVLFMMMYRNPAVALMPDLTPKPLRSKANGIINIMGYIGGAFATVVGIIFVLSTYLKGDGSNAIPPWSTSNIWILETPFLLASVLMVFSAVVLFICINENKVKEEIADDIKLGEALSETADKIDDDKPMTKANKMMLIFILIAEFFWFMADNGIGTFMGNFTQYYLQAASSSNMINIIVGGVGSVLGFGLGGMIAGKIGRKWTVIGGLGLTLLSYFVWIIGTFTFLKGAAASGSFPIIIYVIWLFKGFGMSLVHLNSFPMVVELCNAKKIGSFTGYYYASSMAAQTITPIALGAFLNSDRIDWGFLPVYAAVCVAIAFAIFMFVKNVKVNKQNIVKGLEAFGEEVEL